MSARSSRSWRPASAPPRAQAPRQRPLRTAGQTVEAGGVAAHQRPGYPRVALGTAAAGGGDQPAEVAVAPRARHQEGQPFAVDRLPARLFAGGLALTAVGGAIFRGAVPCQHHLGADQGADARLLRRLVETRRPVDAVAVDQGHRPETQGRRPLDQVLGLGGAVEEGEGRGDVKLGVARPGLAGAGLPGAGVGTAAELLLARSGASGDPLQIFPLVIAEVARRRGGGIGAAGHGGGSLRLESLLLRVLGVDNDVSPSWEGV